MVSGGDVNGLVVGWFTVGKKGEVSDSREQNVTNLVKTGLIVDDEACQLVSGDFGKDQRYFGAICSVKPDMRQAATPEKVRGLLVQSEDDLRGERLSRCRKDASAIVCQHSVLKDAFGELRRMMSDQPGPIQAVSIVTERQRSSGETQRDVKFFAK